MKISLNIDLTDVFKKLRSKKNVMIDGEKEEVESRPNPMIDGGSTTMFINADDISENMKPNMADIARSHKPELTHSK